MPFCFLYRKSYLRSWTSAMNFLGSVITFATRFPSWAKPLFAQVWVVAAPCCTGTIERSFLRFTVAPTAVKRSPPPRWTVLSKHSGLGEPDHPSLARHLHGPYGRCRPSEASYTLTSRRLPSRSCYRERATERTASRSDWRAGC